MSRVIAITSGKGGVGKSNFVLNVGIALAMMDNRVQILDADLGLANLDVLLGIRPHKNIEDVVLRLASIKDIVINTDYKVDLIPGSSGTQDMADLSRNLIDNLVKETIEVSRDSDFLLVDTGSGVSSNVITFLMAVPEVVLGVSPEPTSLTDAYSLIKILSRSGYEGRISLFASMVKNSNSGQGIYKKISSAAQRFLDTQIGYMGSIYQDIKLKKAVSDQVPAIVRFPSSDVARCYRVVATTLLGQEGVDVDYEKFWSRLINMILMLPRPKTMKAIDFDEEASKNGSLEDTVNVILDEQRRTRLLLERLLVKMEEDFTPEEEQKERIV